MLLPFAARGGDTRRGRATACFKQQAVRVSDRQVGRPDQKKRRIGFDGQARHCRFPCRATSEKSNIQAKQAAQ
jgi:hypothetical protein